MEADLEAVADEADNPSEFLAVDGVVLKSLQLLPQAVPFLCLEETLLPHPGFDGFRSIFDGMVKLSKTCKVGLKSFVGGKVGV